MYGVDPPRRDKAQHKQEYKATTSVLGKRKRECLEDGEAEFLDPKRNCMYGVQQNAQPEKLGNSTPMNDVAEEQRAHGRDTGRIEKKDVSVSKL